MMPPRNQNFPGPRALHHLTAAVVAGLLLLESAGAQQRPSFLIPPEIQAQIDRAAAAMAEEDPYWEETVKNALEQFRSENPEVRRSAVMLLGKYPVAPAREAIKQALSDPAAPVRRAAVVSVLEEQGIIMPDLALPLLRLLADPDVSIRRIVSNAVPMTIQHFPLTMTFGDPQLRRDLPEPIRENLRQAFRDPDVTVRRNMVTHYPFLRVDLPQETLVRLLHDEDHEVAIHALRWVLPLLDARAVATETRRLVEHPNPLFRLELARGLQAHRSGEVDQVLTRLQDDPDPAVAIEALLASFHQQPDPRLYERLLDRYRDSGGRGDVAQRIIMAAQLLGPAGEPYLRAWLEDGNPAHRQQAAQAYFGGRGGQPDVELALSLLHDSAPGVRQQALHALIRAQQRLTAEQIETALSVRHADVRRSAVGLTAFLSNERAEDLLLDLLLDEAADVRLAALHQIGNRRLPGWEEIMAFALEEEHPAIRQTGSEWLQRHPTPEALRHLRAYVQRYPQSPLRPRIEIFLRQQNGSDPT
jgi:HEAT repeat protein